MISDPKTSERRSISRPDAVQVVSLRVDVVAMQPLIETIADLGRRGKGGYVCFSTVHMVMEAYDDGDYAEKVNNADIVVPDGMPLVWMQKMFGRRNASRIRANDLMVSLCAYAEENDRTVGFFGSSRQVLDAIQRKAMSDFPRLRIVYRYSPPFRQLTDAEDLSIIHDLTGAAPDFLFVGLGCPKQENWMADHRSQLRSVMLGVGASFDFYAGHVKESPQWLGRLGLEWLYRLWQEPRRLWRRYLIHNPRFSLLAARQIMGRGRRLSRRNL